MALASAQVIARMAALLVAAATPSGARVHTDRMHPVDTYPSTKVFHVDEDLAADDQDDITWPRRRLHRLTVDVMVLCEAASALDTVLAEQARRVLLALEGTLAAATLVPLAGCSLQATGIRYQAPGEHQAAHGSATVRFDVLFTTESNDPDSLV
jgi:hypothetical protein